jgi:UDP:flavonoid glycosyltransferase YjiC (YdhE family)
MRVLLASLDSPGFLHPAIGLAAALQRRGHAVAFVTGAAAAAVLRRHGWESDVCGNGDGRGFETAHWFRPLAAALQVKQIERAMARFACDVLVGQVLMLGPLLVRERCGVPLALQGLATHLWPGGGARRAASAATEERRVWRHADMLGYLNQARALARLPALDALPEASPLWGDMLWLRSIAELHGGTGVPGRLHLVGACIWEPDGRDPDLAGWLDAAQRRGRRIAYVQHGRAFGGPGFWQPLIEALAGGEIQVAAATGRMDDPAAPEARRPEGPEGFFLRPHLSQGAVLSRADLMIGSATTTAVLGALSHGVPCLLIPHGGEQLDLAEQVESAGAARTLAPQGLTAGALRAAVAAVLADSSLRRRARELGTILSSIDGFVESADLLESLAARRSVAADFGPHVAKAPSCKGAP